MDRFPLETLLIFYHIGWEVTQESELLRAAVAVAFCHVNVPRPVASCFWAAAMRCCWPLHLGNQMGVGVPVSKEGNVVGSVPGRML